MKKREEEDEVPLTEIPPSITQETKARFESLLNAALNNESKRPTSKTVKECVIDIEQNDPPKPCPRTVTLQRKKILLPGSGNHSREGSSTSTKSSEGGNTPRIRKIKRSQLLHSAEVHNSPRQSLLSSPEKINSNGEESRKDDDDDDDDHDVTYTISEKPSALPRKNLPLNENKTTGWGDGSDTESSEVVTEMRLSSAKLDKSDFLPTTKTNDIMEQAISSDTSDLVVAKMNVNEIPSRKSSVAEEKLPSEDGSLRIKMPIPLPRRSLTTSQKSGSTSEEKDLSKGNRMSPEEVVVGKTRKNESAASLNLLSSSSHDLEIGTVTKKKVKRKKRTRKHGSSEHGEIEMAEIHSSAKNLGTESSNDKAVEKQHTSSATTMMGVTIHGTDSLQPHSLLRHPMVRVHVVDSIFGEYLKKSDPKRCVSFCEEEVDYILPIMTRHFDFKEHRTLTPTWEEVLIFNEDIGHIVKPDTLLFFEIVDFVNMTVGGLRYQRLGQDSGWHYVAWAFLRLVAVTGHKNTEKRLRLQLYKPQHRYNAHAHRKATSPLVYDWWKQGIIYAKKYSSTLYVTVGSVTPPSAPLTPHLRSRVALQTEQGSVASLATSPAFMTNTDDDDPDESLSTRKDGQTPREALVTWSRLPAQSCKLTNTRLANIPIAPSGGFSLAFSHCGLHLACGTSGPVYVFSVPTFKLINTFNGHKGLVYTVRWSSDDNYLVSASADCTACVWDIRRGHALQVLTHPSFVYCASFVAHFGRRVVMTGCCDGTLRVWRSLAASKFTLTQQLTGHAGFIGAICIDSDGLTVFSGDSFGQLRVWTCDLNSVEWSCSKEVRQRELRGVVINNLVLHPGGNRLLIHTRDSMLRMVDIPSFAVIQWFQGCMNEHMQTGCALSSCGGLVLACSEDGLMCAWESDTGRQLGLYADLLPPSAPAALAYHPHEHMMAFCGHTPGSIQPLVISTYERTCSGEGMNLRLFEVENSLSTRVRENRTEQNRTKTNDDVWQKLESLSSERLDSARVGSAVESSIRTSHTSTNLDDNRFLKPYDSNNRMITSKKKKKRIEKKESSWSRLTKTSGFLVEVTTNKGEVNRGFEIDKNCSSKSNENLLNNLCSRGSIVNESLKFDRVSTHPNKLTDIIERMDKVLLAANNT